VLEEISAVEDTPEEYIFDVFQNKVFPDDALGFPILGTNEDVVSINRQKILSFYEKYYKPDNIIISAAGKVDHKQLVDLVKHNFNLSGKASASHIRQAKAQTKISYALDKKINQSHICIGGQAVSYLDEKRFDLIALNTYLGAGLSSVLFQVLREELGYVYSVYSFLDFYQDTGLIGFYLGTDPKNRKQAIERLHTELKKITDNKIKDDQILILKEQMKGSFFLSLESTFKRMTRLAKNEIYYKKFISYDELIDSINHISAESILDAAQNYLTENNLNSVMISPGSN
jgi:predicted Zn-dependent peptidase